MINIQVMGVKSIAAKEEIKVKKLKSKNKETQDYVDVQVHYVKRDGSCKTPDKKAFFCGQYLVDDVIFSS